MIKTPPVSRSLLDPENPYLPRFRDLMILFYGAGVFLAFCAQSQMDLAPEDRMSFWLLIVGIVAGGIYIFKQTRYRISIGWASILFGAMSIYGGLQGLIIEPHSMNVFAVVLGLVLILTIIIGVGLLFLARSLFARDKAKKAALRGGDQL